jgi:hypothetical protein
MGVVKLWLPGWATKAGSTNAALHRRREKWAEDSGFQAVRSNTRSGCLGYHTYTQGWDHALHGRYNRLPKCCAVL